MTNSSCPPGFGFSTASEVLPRGSRSGSTEDDGKCDPCVPGKSKPGQNAEACAPCPAGQWSNASVIGGGSDDGGIATCALCPKGTYLMDASGTLTSHDELSDCTPCPPLSYNPLEGHDEDCFPCITARVPGSIECAGW